MEHSNKSHLLDRDELVRSLVSGERRMHELPAVIAPEEAAAVRRQALSEMTGASLDHLGSYSLDARKASHRHCENFIGAAQVPVGIAGPIPVNGNYANGEFYLPLATTEAALIASVNRGCAALRRSGGATVFVEDVGMTRGPVFRTSGIIESRALVQWVEVNVTRFEELTASTSRYLRLREVSSTIMGATVFLRFRFACGDAMGMNMTTFAVDRIVREIIEPETGVACVAISGNYCVDKKPSALNFVLGRGKRIHAEVTIAADVLRKTLKTTAAVLAEVQYRKNLLGSIAAGAMGFNAHYANILAAFFIATGQDVAQVVEGSLGVTCVEARDNGAIYASVYLPDVPLAALGGGTGLETQREALALMGITPDGAEVGAAVMRLAELVGAAVLAGEVSLLAALSSNELASAHERLARGTTALTRNADFDCKKPR
ncbi:MAG: hydroxymethylglutaryl-CoA reductase (NADPH) [Candidatus Schekmanbacteria bacterium]|nr:hydroxymethylglutaryl-CoA reductase (NADPH) [Candidatus Schekmanbacteria bacterium]